MARIRIRQAHGGSDRVISDGALPFFLSQGWVVIDTIDDDSDNPPLYLSAEESDARFAALGEIGDAATPTGSELRTFLEQKIDRTGATTGDVPVLQADGSLALETGGGGGGAVASVNGATGTVVLDADDISDGTTSVTMTAAERTALALFLANGIIVQYNDGVGADPNREATTARVLWITPDANRPATSGTTAGGTYAAVDNHDLLWTF